MTAADDWFRAHGFARNGSGLWGKAWPMRSGFDYTDLEFYPLDKGWDAIVGHHASGTNPRMPIGTCETLADVEMVYNAIRLTNGYPAADEQ